MHPHLLVSLGEVQALSSPRTPHTHTSSLSQTPGHKKRLGCHTVCILEFQLDARAASGIQLSFQGIIYRSELIAPILHQYEPSDRIPP